MKTEHKVIATSIIFGSVVWAVVAVVDFLFFYDGSFLDVLICDKSGHDLYMRSLIVICFAVFGALLWRVVAKGKRAEEALRKSEEAERRFGRQLVDLVEVINELSMLGTFDEVCRRAVELGRSRLGFDRLGIWFRADEPETVVGSFGVAENGQICDERAIRTKLNPDTPDGRVLLSKEPLVLEGKLPSANYREEVVGAFAGICDGEKVIGHVSMDNLIRKEAITEHECELLRLFAAALGYLCTRKRAEEERTRLATAIEQVAEGIIVTDADGTIQYVNPAFERLTGYTREEVIGMNPRVLKSGRQDEAFYRQMWDMLTRGEVWTGRLTNKKKDGSLFEEEATISPVRDAAGRTTHYVAVKRDVTREAELEARLRRAQKMEAIGTLAGGIAHDFNNILHAVLGYTELAMCGLPRDAEVRGFLEEVHKAGKRAADLVNQMLTFSRQTERERKPVRLHPVIKETLKLLRGSLPSTIEIRPNIDAGCGTVLADPTQVQQVLMNLCTNAYYAMRERGGVLEVSLEETGVDPELAAEHPDLEPGRYARLIVSDTGHGMDQAIMDRIFEPYFTTKEAGEGTGLGLATVHGIVKSHGGAVTVKSEPGQGTTFSVFFPLCVQEVSTSKDEVAKPPLRKGEGRILLIDDEDQIARLARTFLERLGYEVRAYTSSVEALKAFRANPDGFDVVVTDQTMPNLTGVELLRELLLIRPNLPVILCTGFSEIVNKQQAKAMGIREYVMKPIVAGDLAKVIQRVLGQEETRGE